MLGMGLVAPATTAAAISATSSTATAAATDMASAINSAAAVASGNVSLAIWYVMKSIGNTQFAVDAEEEGQPVGRFGVDAFTMAGQFPGALDAILGFRWALHAFGWDVVQEAAKPSTAEGVVVACKQDEFVPGVIHDLGWHGYHAAAGNAAEMEILRQRLKNKLALAVVEFRPLSGQSGIKQACVVELTDKSFARLACQAVPNQQDYSESKNDQKVCHASSSHQMLADWSFYLPATSLIQRMISGAETLGEFRWSVSGS